MKGMACPLDEGCVVGGWVLWVGGGGGGIFSTLASSSVYFLIHS